jgi:hypothetical protein
MNSFKDLVISIFAKWHSIWKKGARTGIMYKTMQPWLGKVEE